MTSFAKTAIQRLTNGKKRVIIKKISLHCRLIRLPIWNTGYAMEKKKLLKGIALGLALVLSTVAIVVAFTTECNHQFGDWEVIKESNCMEKGIARRVCKFDHLHYEEEEIAKLPHELGEVVVVKQPTCEEKGHKITYCKYEINGEKHKRREEQIDALGHDYDEATGICKREGCGKEKPQEE